MALRLRYEIESPARLREHVHMVDGAGYFFFPAVSAAQGTLAVLEVTFTETDRPILLRGWVWAKPSAGGVWLELPEADKCLRQTEASPRGEPRMATDQLVLAEGAGHAGLLCRLRDVSPGGARIAANAADLGDPGSRVKVTLPEQGPSGGQLEAFGRVVWTVACEAAVEWSRGDLSSRHAVRRMMQLAEEEWESARRAAHPRTCRCSRNPALEVLLLG